MTVCLLRHGRTAYNEQGRYLGKTDAPLSPAGAAELRAADFAPEIDIIGIEYAFIDVLIERSFRYWHAVSILSVCD